MSLCPGYCALFPVKAHYPEQGEAKTAKAGLIWTRLTLPSLSAAWKASGLRRPEPESPCPGWCALSPVKAHYPEQNKCQANILLTPSTNNNCPHRHEHTSDAHIRPQTLPTDGRACGRIFFVPCSCGPFWSPSLRDWLSDWPVSGLWRARGEKPGTFFEF